MASRFAVTRADGRSNTQVVCDLVAPCEPGEVVAYQPIGDALGAGSTRVYTRAAVQGAVRNALPTLARLHKRALQNVPGAGYRVALAREHMGLAVTRKDKARRQMRMGMTILQHVRYNEMDEQTRLAHQGHLMITEAILRNQDALERRMRAVEVSVEKLKTGAGV